LQRRFGRSMSRAELGWQCDYSTLRAGVEGVAVGKIGLACRHSGNS
jgi:hypothetical protein